MKHHDWILLVKLLPNFNQLFPNRVLTLLLKLIDSYTNVKNEMNLKRDLNVSQNKKKN